MAAIGALLIAVAAGARQEPPDDPKPQRIGAAEPAGQVPWPPRLRPNGPEVIEMPEVRSRRERMVVSTAQTLDRTLLSKVRVGAPAREAAARLDDPAFETREAASRALLDRAIGDAEIWALLDQSTLSDEAHERLLSVAVRRVLDKPRGALGVSMGTGPRERPGVLVQSTLRGMPAERVLRIGDVIEAIDGRQLNDPDDLSEVLQGLAPGTEVLLVVLRTERDAQGKPMIGPGGKAIERRVEVRLPLGNADDLDRVDPGMPRSTNRVKEQRLMQAELVRMRFARPLPPAIPVPSSADEAVRPAPPPGVAP